MTAGVLVGALSLSVLAEARLPWVYLSGWAGLGVTQAMCLYEVCFALLIRRFGVSARMAITRVTLVAGLASTLCFPAAAMLAQAVGWRGALWTGVAVAVLVMLPLQWFGARAIGRGPAEGRPVSLPAPRPGEVLRRPGFARLALMFSLMNLNHWMLISFTLPVFTAQGLRHGLAVAAAACIGPAQVLGRLALMRSEARIGTRRATVGTLAAIVAAALLLALAGVAPAFAFAFAAVQGAAMGVMTILRPILVAERLGSGTYGAIAGMMSIPTLVSTAAAPLAGALILSTGGEALLVGVAMLLAIAALALALVDARAA
jgi:predicted MFS family arabinose efflux permease